MVAVNPGMPMDIKTEPEVSKNLSIESIRSMQSIRMFNDHSQPFNSISYNDNGTFMLASSGDDYMTVIDVVKGGPCHVALSQKYGFSHAKFLHCDQSIIHASIKGDHQLRLLSLYDSQYVRYFKGHDSKVTGISIGPVDDTIISSSCDNTLRLWDARVEKSTGVFNLTQQGKAAFDPEELIIAVMIGSDTIKLYDRRSFDNGPFISFDFSERGDRKWDDLCFSEDGKSILIMTSGDHMRLIDAFNGDITHTLQGHVNTKNVPLKATFTPDSRFILVGGTDGRITVYDREEGKITHTYMHEPEEMVQHVLFNPYYHMFASAGKSVKLWTLT